MRELHYHPGRKLTANCLNTLIDRVPVKEQERSLNHELFNLGCLLFEMARSTGACELMKARLCAIGMENAQDECRRAVIFKHYAKGTLDEHFASVLLVTLSFFKTHNILFGHGGEILAGYHDFRSKTFEENAYSLLQYLTAATGEQTRNTILKLYVRDLFDWSRSLGIDLYFVTYNMLKYYE